MGSPNASFLMAAARDLVKGRGRVPDVGSRNGGPGYWGKCFEPGTSKLLQKPLSRFCILEDKTQWRAIRLKTGH